ncbi:MAG: 50S ribosomal protein L17 [Alistipes senegalensis]|nr:50S ribosomal protein L17 [Bacteroides cellulosilyticus]MCM1352407.1 50S ribosomal protein L17 [Alistipes senegalensis]
MRHNKNFNHLGRQAGHRKAMLSNMASSLILHKRIETTVAKAKAVQQFVEPLVTKSKEDTTHSRRVVFSYLKQKEAVAELFRTIAPKIAERPGGYTRILKTGFRLGDGADMCIIEFVDFNEAYTLGIAPTAAAEAKPKTRRSRSKKAATDAVEEATVVETETTAAKAAPAPKKAAASKAKASAPKTAAPKAPKAAAAKTAAPKAAKKTNVGKKM